VVAGVQRSREIFWPVYKTTFTPRHFYVVPLTKFQPSFIPTRHTKHQSPDSVP
jgi:DUF1365 family protein